MAANRKLIFQIPIILGLLSGCGFVGATVTPESWGSQAGKDGAELWIQENGQGNWPSVDSAAAFCVAIAEEGLKIFEWSYAQVMEASDSCTEAFVKGLG